MGDGLTLRPALLAVIVDHCRAEYPLEACGVLAGRDGQPSRHIPMVNAEQSPHWFRFAPAEQLAVWADMDARGEQPMVIYHSHPHGEAYPSRTDVALASLPDAHHLIVSLRRDPPEVRAYRITSGVVIE